MIGCVEGGMLLLVWWGSRIAVQVVPIGGVSRGVDEGKEIARDGDEGTCRCWL